jgi:hypothetical protein
MIGIEIEEYLSLRNQEYKALHAMTDQVSQMKKAKLEQILLQSITLAMK